MSDQPLTTKDILNLLQDNINKGVFKVMNNDGYRYYTDVLTESIVIPLTTQDEVAALYKKLVLDTTNGVVPTVNPFDALPRVSMFIGQPDTGKTYLALQIAKECGIEPLFKMCRDNLNLETLLEDFKLENGKPVFTESLAIKLLSGTERGIIILDEFNTLLTGVMKTLQPIFDDTSTTFEYKGKIYNKNMNCKFIVTLNDKDKGVSIVPDAILSRTQMTWFNPVPLTKIAQWTNVPLPWITTLYDIYKLVGALNVFGTRQVKMLYGKPNNVVVNHLEGLCRMKNIKTDILGTLQMKTMIGKL